MADVPPTGGRARIGDRPPPPNLENPNFYCYLAAFLLPFSLCRVPGACPGIRMGGGGGGLNLKAFFFAFQFFSGGGGPAQIIAKKMIFSTKKAAKY